MNRWLVLLAVMLADVAVTVLPLVMVKPLATRVFTAIASLKPRLMVVVPPLVV